MTLRDISLMTLELRLKDYSGRPFHASSTTDQQLPWAMFGSASKDPCAGHCRAKASGLFPRKKKNGHAA